uniref:Peptidase C1A papain C-terminal domain-containing protein n=1 Tax=viral metagenome TaxID=1070528 RepID=A0A6C0H4F3_9ZZZZ
MSDINLGVCRERKPSKILPSPAPCSAGRDLQYEDLHSDFKGPFVNFSFSNIPDSEVFTTPDNVLSDLSTEDIPSEWSWKKQGGNKIEDGSRNQGRCGCCWAMAFVSSLGDRYAIKNNIAAPYPSAMWMVSCGGSKIGSRGENGSFAENQQCLCGGSTYAAGKWMEEGNNVGLESCWPFSTISSGPGTYVAPNCPLTIGDDCCSDCCGNPDSKVKFTIEKGSTKCIVVANQDKSVNVEATIRAIQSDIKNNGPIVTTFWVPDDFQDWWSSADFEKDIYIPSQPSTIGYNGHSVVLTGWGKENGVNFWEMRNSWGSPGYCRFAMSSSTPRKYWCGIDLPEFSEGSWQGGTISFIPGKLSDHNWEKGNDNEVSNNNDDLSNINWKLIGIIAGVFVGVIFLIIIISMIVS